MENVVMVKLSDYERLLTDKHIAQEELRYERQKNTHFNDMKKYLLEKSLDEYRIKSSSYSLEEITDITKYQFALSNPIRLLKSGIEYEEMVEFIKSKYEEYHKEDENAD